MRKAAVNASAAKLVPRKWPSARSLASPVMRDSRMPVATRAELRREAPGLLDGLSGRPPQASCDQFPGRPEIPAIPNAVGCGPSPPQRRDDIAHQSAPSFL